MFDIQSRYFLMRLLYFPTNYWMHPGSDQRIENISFSTKMKKEKTDRRKEKENERQE